MSSSPAARCSADRRIRRRQVDHRLAALAFARPGCRITGGQIVLDGTDLRGLSSAGRRQTRGVRVAYVAQSAAAAFNPR